MDYILSKDEIKEQLPLRYAMPRLGYVLDRSGKCICPFHPDNDPSLQVYANDEGRERLHCYPCGFDGDIFDFIMQAHGCSFPEAISEGARILSELPEDYTPPTPPKREVTVSDIEHRNAVIANARSRVKNNVQAAAMAVAAGFVGVTDESLAVKWGEYLRSWGWGLNELGEVLIPHQTHPGLDGITGCKVRKLSREKDAIRPSEFPVLYGTWRDRKHADALLTEGETDCLFAAFSAKEENVGIDVYSLPRGASSEISDEWITFLKKRRGTIYLAFDPDRAGIDATWKWIEALTNAGLKNVKVCRLPRGKDLRDAKPSLRHLLNTAYELETSPTNIEIAEGCYARSDRDGVWRLITNWSLDPVANLVGGESTGYDVLLKTRGGVKETTIALVDLLNLNSLKKWCTARGLIFTGRDDDVQRIAEHLRWRASVVPEVYQTDQVGLHEPPHEYEFTGPAAVFPDGSIGQMPWRYVPSPRVADVSGKTLLPASGAFNWSWLEDFLQLSSSSVMHPFLAWLVAATRREEMDRFPLLFIGGSSGVGKSTLAELGLQLVGSKVTVDLGNVTPFILTRTLASSTTVPVFVDEWTRMSRKDAREAFQGAIPVLYAGGLAERGQADLSSMVYRLTAPVVVAGEDTFMLDREIERMVAITPSRSAQNHPALSRLTGKPIQRFGQLLYEWLARQPELPPVPATAATRVKYSREVLEAGWATLRALLHETGRYEDVPEIPERPDLTSISQLAEETENVYEQALLLGMSMSDRDRHPVVWADPDGKGTWVRFQVLIGLLQQQSVDLQLPGGSRAMKAYFTERYGEPELGQSIVPPNHFTGLRAWLIRGYQLPISEVSQRDPRETWVP